MGLETEAWLDRVLRQFGSLLKDAKADLKDDIRDHEDAVLRESLRHSSRLRELEAKVDKMSHALARHRINGGPPLASKPASATGPNVYALDLGMRAKRWETIRVVALAVAAVATIGSSILAAIYL